MSDESPREPTIARAVKLRGRVQGVGFRPFVFTVADRLGVKGTVQNRSGTVYIHAEGSAFILDQFVAALVREAPRFARPELAGLDDANVRGLEDFRILDSESDLTSDVSIPPDVAMCEECNAELYEKTSRRFDYPFNNCTQCGPRYTIIESLPYDRERTSMSSFPMCDECGTEYSDVMDRRFHAEPIACPRCGPKVWWESDGVTQREPQRALQTCIAALAAGNIIGVRGVGGYHLICDATNDDAVEMLRSRKRRPSKPLALMVPAPIDAPLSRARRIVDLDDVSSEALLDPTRPIVLAPRSKHARISAKVAPGMAELGLMLPYSPLHALLLDALDRPMVFTSGNASGEPLSFTVGDAQRVLRDAVDGFLHHDRPIVRPIDDSVVRPIGGVPVPIRLARGFAPLELSLPREVPRPIIAVGAHMKSTVTLAWGNRAVVSPHIGGLDSPAAVDAFERTITELCTLFDVHPQVAAVDAHPDYASRRWANDSGLPIFEVWHHHAHASALAFEHPDVATWLTLTWDGVGLGPDGSLWGGEFLFGSPGQWTRVGTQRPFYIPGAGRAGRQPWRSAAALCWEVDLPWTPEIGTNARLARQAWERGVQTTMTTSVGRIFDAAAALVLKMTRYGHEAHGPMLLESVSSTDAPRLSLPISQDHDGTLRMDWAPLLPILGSHTLAASERAGILHARIATTAVKMISRLRERFDFSAVGLTGGVFQNRLLTEMIRTMLIESGVDVRLGTILPPNDGGISLGQIVEHQNHAEQ